MCYTCPMPPALTQVHAYWTAFFGLSVFEFIDLEPKVVPHAGLGEYQGAWLFRHGGSTIASVPPEYVTTMRTAVQTWRREDWTDANFIGLFGAAVSKVIGPAYQGYLEPADFRPSPLPARVLSEADDAALNVLKTACSPEDWSHANMDSAPQPVFGAFHGSQLVAVANLEMWAPNVASPGLVTHPDFRGQGFGRAVLSAACEYGFNQEYLVLYQTLESNLGAVRTAEGIGFQQFATHLAVRL